MMYEVWTRQTENSVIIRQCAFESLDDACDEAEERVKCGAWCAEVRRSGSQAMSEHLYGGSKPSPGEGGGPPGHAASAASPDSKPENVIDVEFNENWGDGICGGGWGHGMSRSWD